MAVFVFCDLTDTELATAHPFYYEAQFQHAKKVILVPMALFHDLADDLGLPTPLSEGNADGQFVGDVILLYSTGRCGSTLLSKMVESLPHTLSLSEPDSFTHIAGLGLDAAAEARMLRSTLSWEAKRLRHGACSRVFIKLRSQCTPQAEAVARVFPGAKLLYMYRHAHKVVQSFENTFGVIPVVRALFHTPILRQGLLSAMKKGIPADVPAYRDAAFLAKIDSHMFAWFALNWVGNCDWYAKLRAKGVKISAVRYEDLVAHPKECFRRLCDELAMPATGGQTEVALHSLANDSQEGSTASARTAPARPLSQAEKELIDGILLMHPTINRPEIVLPGTLLHQ